MACVDGGLLHNTNFVSAIKSCQEKGYADEDIIIDILNIKWHGPESQYPKSNLTNGIDNMKRYFDIWKYTWSGRDISEWIKAFPKVNFRYFIHRSAGCNIDDLDFENKDTWPCQMIGRKDGANVISKGEGYYFRKMDEYYDSK